ncbi:hypothetical protein [Anoxybacillus flavithermus]|uniref:hypothetical protein n=1 Tax=Anoxybacillus flavithermus TaxID=33934 RepID=UPI001866E086|nr:hypothetical protein [Anoxybacillus flavithermus]MBE2926571.1 hypothetical protein [Anoxybacillus flavithermus]MBE2937442.1 hypothetical protein [Anoxybacillus flavithermus]MBE2945136.1 hypothetical protein [Anoxybacillus flavithermus]MBE2948128.1 hypothetical protein [Anoxybacillus flavithermus]
MMKTVQLTEHELAILKTALHMQIQQMKREKAKGAYVDAEILQQYEQAFEALSFAK